MRRLHLSRRNRKISGVCGGIGETYDIDPNVVSLAAPTKGLGKVVKALVADLNLLLYAGVLLGHHRIIQTSEHLFYYSADGRACQGHFLKKLLEGLTGEAR